jgi:NTP pyrophosphatase (non-canonical NTP hydrolase)
LTLKEIADRHVAWLKSVGWFSADVTPLENLALITSEIGEAVNECRQADIDIDKLATELADILLRVLGMSRKMGLNVEQAVIEKMAINEARGNRGRVK